MLSGENLNPPPKYPAAMEISRTAGGGLVGVGVGVRVAVGVVGGVVGVGLGVGWRVAVGVAVGVGEGADVGVEVGVAVAVGDGGTEVGVGVAVAVGVGVLVGVAAGVQEMARSTSARTDKTLMYRMRSAFYSPGVFSSLMSPTRTPGEVGTGLPWAGSSVMTMVL